MIEFLPQHVKVLIVDDTPDNVKVAGSILAEEGYDLYIADSGIVAEQLARETVFDLILLDIMMPKQDGFTTCTHLRKIPEYESVPIIFLSARIDIDSIIKGFDLGAVDYIRKPFNPQELKSRVKTHADLRLYRQELERRNSQLENALLKIEEIARTDDLTGLLNRREMVRLFEYEINRTNVSKHEFSLIMLDIDLFKEINDTHGHLTGDHVLQRLARQLQASSRKQDYISRWGGDEFLILLPEITDQNAAKIAEEIRSDIEQIDFSDLFERGKVTVTCGVSCHRDKMPIQSLVDNVDKAMLLGKSRSRNCVMLYTSEGENTGAIQPR